MVTAKTTPKSKASKKKPLKKTVFDPKLKCSFCGKSADSSYRLIALDPPSKICICDECIEVCNKMLMEENPNYFVSRITRIFAEYTDKNKLKGDKKMNTKKTTKTAKAKPQPKAQTRAKQKGKQRPKSKG
jgi:hypothetical protein